MSSGDCEATQTQAHTQKHILLTVFLPGLVQRDIRGLNFTMQNRSINKLVLIIIWIKYN